MFHPCLILAPGFLREDGVTNGNRHIEGHHPQKSLLRGILSDVSGSVWPDGGVKEEDQCNIALIMICWSKNLREMCDRA